MEMEGGKGKQGRTSKGKKGEREAVEEGTSSFVGKKTFCGDRSTHRSVLQTSNSNVLQRNVFTQHPLCHSYLLALQAYGGNAGHKLLAPEDEALPLLQLGLPVRVIDYITFAFLKAFSITISLTCP